MDSDVLGSVLAPLRLHGAYFSDWRLHPYWAVQGVPEPRALIHYMLEGHAVVRFGDGTSHALGDGDLAMFPRGAAHIVSDGPRTTAPFIGDLLPDRPAGGSAVLHLGDPTAEPIGRMLCAGLDYDPLAVQPLYKLLPDIMVVRAEHLSTQPLLHDLLAGILAEADRPGACADAVQLRAFELAFLLGMRIALRDTDSQLARAIRHPRLGAALVAINAEFVRPWTVSRLAALAGLSESTFVREFVSTIGVRPAVYLRTRRMLEARSLLAGSSLPLEQIAARVGYGSVVGFHQAFRRECGITPGQYRAAPAS